MSVDDHRDDARRRTIATPPPPQNKEHASDLNAAVHYTRWFLTCLGIWPRATSAPTSLERNMAKFFLPFSALSMIVLVVPIVAHVATRQVNRLELFALLGPISFQTTNIVKHFILLIRADAIKLCVRHMAADWRRIGSPADREIMMRSLRVGHAITTICAVCMYSGAAMFHAIMPLWQGDTTNERNETVRPLAYPGTDIFVDLSAGRNYELVFSGNCVSAFFHFTVVTAICNIAAIFVSHACGQIQIVVARLESLVGDADDDKMAADGGGGSSISSVEERIAFIVRCHARVLRFSANIDRVLQEVCLIEVGASMLIICFLEYYCMTEWSNCDTVAIVTYIVLLISECFNIYIFCHIGELLKEQFIEVGKASYQIEWYRLPGKTGLALVMIIAMANDPRKLTAGGMIELSMTSFSNIMKTSLGYLNMVRAMAT